MAITPDRQPYIQPITPEWYQHKVAEVAMLRLDVVHNEVSGNKWYKLKHNIAHCLNNSINCIVTFGGAHSNHLVATAAMAHKVGLQAIGIVRGNYENQQLTPTLEACIGYGMKLQYLSYSEYSKKHTKEMLRELSEKYKGALIIPEGGANSFGRVGAGEIVQLIPQRFTHVAISVGTGTTLTGIVNNVSKEIEVVGFAPMKGGIYLNNEVREVVTECRREQFVIHDNWNFGGFGKHTKELLNFMNSFFATQYIPLDMVYTAKMMYGILEQIKNDIYKKDSKILCIHTGGLQGNGSVKNELSY